MREHEGSEETDSESGMVPEAAISQPWSDERDATATDASEIRAAYGIVRAHFKTNPDRYRLHQRLLKQARYTETYDVYHARSIRLAGLGAGLGAVVVGAVVAVLVVTGLFRGLLEPVFALTQPTLALFAASPPFVTAVVLSLFVGASVGLAVVVARAIRPKQRLERRRRNIDHNLPYAIMFMYALSRGGMNVVEVSRRLADAEDMYGEVANEFEAIAREIDLFGNGPLQALENVQAITPSENLRRFLDDLHGVLESGGDLDDFLEREAERHTETAQAEQAAFLDTLGTMSELFVVAFVAAPLLLIVVLMVVSFLGADTLAIIGVLIYVAFPLGMAGFLLVVDRQSHGDSVVTPLRETWAPPAPSDRVADDDRFETYDQQPFWSGLRAFVTSQVASMHRRPLRTLWLTVPVALAMGTLAVVFGPAMPSLDAFVDTPVATTTGLVVVPVVVALVPLTVLHERNRRRSKRVAQRLPDALDVLANANEMGIGLVDGCGLVAQWGEGRLATEFQRVRNDLAWNHDIERALLALANRMAVPQLTRTMTLIAIGSRSSGDLYNLLEIAATDTRSRADLDRERRRQVSAYVVIVVIGFLVYLVVILMVSVSYLEPIGELTAGVAGGPDAPEMFSGVGAAPVGTYRMLFYHSALIQGFGSGLIAGKLANDDVVSGLPYALGLVGLTVLAFVVVI
ncbi:type II secretion system F family protein [Halococcoides cellulosivorans]|uniref:Type II secretion protein F n=1 Tax=Halococcoides cellulosivorans TaxID=1679096 RepID=A0A2R4WZE8_9EURY|nr:type II secretion system F family protein [Halococcoides cellulosivorans]AWB26918.1 type II secretion protein F [Halococcoides cellulosivorans]